MVMTESAVCAAHACFPPSCSTGKERDTESGNDYFGARYFSSAMGRFLSPDWSAKIEPVPYSKRDDPQTLNLYAYVMNNPLGRVDADGHAPMSWGGFQDCSELGNCSNPMLTQQNAMEAQANQEAQKSWGQQMLKKFDAFVSHLRLVVISDSVTGGWREVLYKVAYLSDNGNIQSLDKIDAQFKELDVTENNSVICKACVQDSSGVWHSTDRTGNQFDDLVSVEPAGSRVQSFSVSPHDGGPSASISVRLAGQDYGKIGQWSDGYHYPYVNGKSYQQGLPGGYPPSQ
jgi:RHS repeat-associated protein